MGSPRTLACRCANRTGRMVSSAGITSKVTRKLMLDVKMLVGATVHNAHRDLTCYHWVWKLRHLGDVSVVSVPAVANGWGVLGRHEPHRFCRCMLGREKSGKKARLGRQGFEL